MNIAGYFHMGRVCAERDALRAEVERLRKQITDHVCPPTPQVHWFPPAGAANPATATITYWPGGERSPQTFIPSFSNVCAGAAAAPPPLTQVWNVTAGAGG